MAKNKSGNEIGKKVPPGFYLTKDAAKKVRRHPDRLREWRKTGLIVPSGQLEMGKLKMAMYSEEDIEAMKQLVAKYRQGAPYDHDDDGKES